MIKLISTSGWDCWTLFFSMFIVCFYWRLVEPEHHVLVSYIALTLLLLWLTINPQTGRPGPAYNSGSPHFYQSTFVVNGAWGQSACCANISTCWWRCMVKGLWKAKGPCKEALYTFQWWHAVLFKQLLTFSEPSKLNHSNQLALCWFFQLLAVGLSSFCFHQITQIYTMTHVSFSCRPYT